MLFSREPQAREWRRRGATARGAGAHGATLCFALRDDIGAYYYIMAEKIYDAQ